MSLFNKYLSKRYLFLTQILDMSTKYSTTYINLFIILLLVLLIIMILMNFFFSSVLYTQIDDYVLVYNHLRGKNS